MKANNILVHKIKGKENKKFTYRVLRKNYIVPNIGYSIKLWDFDFANIPGYVNNIKASLDSVRPIGVSPKQNQYYDIHYFFNTLAFTGFFPKFMITEHIPNDVKEFVSRVVPLKFRTVTCTHGNDEATLVKNKEENLEVERVDCNCYKYVHERGRLRAQTEHITPAQMLSDPFFSEFVKE
jgi:hypothetical protein